MARILVMGAGGYIGIPLCEALEERGHFVQAVDRFYFGKYPKLRNSAPLHADIRTYDCAGGMFDVVMDLAGLSNDATAEINPSATRSVNLEGATRLATLAKDIGVKKYVYASSCSVYGAGVKDGLIETDDCKPLTLYAECKLRVEDHLRSIQSKNFESIILRNATVFGASPRMRFDLAVNAMTERAWSEGLIYVMGGGQQMRPFVHVSDVVSAFILAVEKIEHGTVLNVGSNDLNLSIERLAYLVHRHFNDAKIHHIPDEADKRSYVVNFDKISKLGYRTTRSIENGIGEVHSMLLAGKIEPPTKDPTSHTLSWYKSLVEWDRRLSNLRHDGPIP